MSSNTIKYFNFNVTFKVSKDDTFSEVMTFIPKVDNPINLFLDIENKSENKYSFPNDQDLPNIKKFSRLLRYDFNEASEPPYLSLQYNDTLVNNYKSNGSGFDFYDGSIIKGKIEVNATDVFKTGQTEDNNYCKIWLNEELWKEEEEAEIESFNKTYSFVIYFIDSENDLFVEKDVRIPSIYRPFYMQNYIILSSKNVRYMFNINNAVGLKDKNRYYIGDVETSIQVNGENRIDFKPPTLYLDLSNTNNLPLLFKNYNLSRDTTSGEVTDSSETITLKYKIQFKEKEPDFSHTDFLINSVYEENNLSFYGIKYSVNHITINDKKCAQIYINQVKGTSSNGIRYFVTNMEFSKLVNNVTAITVPPENYDLYPSDIRGNEKYTESGSEKFYYGGVYSFHRIFKTAPDDASIDSQNYSNRYAYELKNLYEYTEWSKDGYYILTYTYRVPDGATEDDIKKANFHIVAIYDPVTLLSDDDMIQEQLYSKILKPHNNFTSIMRIY